MNEEIIAKIDKNIKFIINGLIFLLIVMFILAIKITSYEILVSIFDEKLISAQVSFIENFHEVKVRTDEAIMDLVRTQLELMADNAKQNIGIYLNNNSNIKFYTSDVNGYTCFSSRNGGKIYFNPKIMVLEKQVNKLYLIKNIETKKILLEDAYPEWNFYELNKLFENTILSWKAFGSTGDSFVYDPNTMMMLFDASADCAPDKSIVEKDGNAYFDLIYKHPFVANPNGFNYLSKTEYSWKKDSTKETGLIMLFSEPTLLSGNSSISQTERNTETMKTVNNFRKYPLGQYLREFDARRNILNEVVGISTTPEGINMQLSYVIGAQEQDIVKGFSNLRLTYDNVLTNFINNMRIIKENKKQLLELIIVFPIILMAISIFGIILAIFAIKNLEKKLHLQTILDLEKLNKEKM